MAWPKMAKSVKTKLMVGKVKTSVDFNLTLKLKITEKTLNYDYLAAS